MTIDEIFASMPEEDAATGRDYLVIDPAARSITVPASEKVFGVEGDENAARKYFICPRYVGDNLDLAGMFLTVYWRNANGDEDGYMVEDVQITGEYVTFSWPLSEKAVAYNGRVQFAVCADLPNTAEKHRPDWNTTLAEGQVLEGMDPDLGDLETGSSDVLTQLREMVTAQTAAVEATGAAQVDVVEAAGAAATADAQEQIEAKGAATLATIPEDYTTLANKTNEQANAIKGRLAGQIVRADDVSPVEHSLGVKVHGKNRFYTAKDVTGAQYGITYTTAENSAEILLDGTASEEWAWTCENTITLPAGTYTISAIGLNSDEINGHDRLFVRYAATSEVLVNHVITGGAKSFTLETAGEIRVYMVFKAGSSYNAATVSIQIEEGTVATEYTPYIDPAGVTVTRCGKNLLPFPFATADATFYGVAITSQNGVLTLNGTATHGTSLPLFSGAIPVKGKYTFSGVNGGSGDTYYLQPHVDNLGRPGVTDGPKVYEWDGMLTKVNLSFSAGATFNNLKISPMLEAGDQASAYEPYNGATAMPDESGTVTGLPSLAPTMTLLTDTAGVTIDCIYNRDSNAVYAELLAKIAALSGTT